jgi:hypothetical protein
MTREKEIKREAKYSANGTIDDELAEMYFIRGAEWADQHPRKGLLDGEKVIEWLDKYADSYTYFNVDKQETEFIGQMFEDLKKSMEE